MERLNVKEVRRLESRYVIISASLPKSIRITMRVQVNTQQLENPIREVQLKISVTISQDKRSLYRCSYHPHFSTILHRFQSLSEIGYCEISHTLLLWNLRYLLNQCPSEDSRRTAPVSFERPQCHLSSEDWEPSDAPSAEPTALQFVPLVVRTFFSDPVLGWVTPTSPP